MSTKKSRKARIVPATKSRQRKPEVCQVFKVGVRNDARLMLKKEVLDRIGVTYPTLWHWMREERFPMSRQLGGKVCWLASEVEAFMQALPKSRLKAAAA